MLSGLSLFAFILFIVALLVVIRAVRVVPQQRAWVLERVGRFHAVLEPGLSFIVPFVDRIAYKHDLREIPLDDAAPNWGVKVLRYEIKDLTPPAEILRAMQAQITAEREKRAVIATSEGKRQEQINLAVGAREAAIAKSEGEKQAEINGAQGQAAAILSIAEANAKAIRQVAEAIAEPGGMDAVNLKVAEEYITAFGNLARIGNTLVVPANLTDVAAFVTTATSILKSKPPTPVAK